MFYERGKLHIENRALPRAILDLDQALRLAPDFPEALVLRGQVYGKLGNWGRTMRDFEQVLDRLLRLDPNNPRALLNDYEALWFRVGFGLVSGWFRVGFGLACTFGLINGRRGTPGEDPDE